MLHWYICSKSKCNKVKVLIFFLSLKGIVHPKMSYTPPHVVLFWLRPHWLSSKYLLLCSENKKYRFGKTWKQHFYFWGVQSMAAGFSIQLFIKLKWWTESLGLKEKRLSDQMTFPSNTNLCSLTVRDSEIDCSALVFLVWMWMCKWLNVVINMYFIIPWSEFLGSNYCE